jgi:hypothetical protein
MTMSSTGIQVGLINRTDPATLVNKLTMKQVDEDQEITSQAFGSQEDLEQSALRVPTERKGMPQ